MASIELHNVSLAYPVYGVRARSLKTSLIHLAIGGRLNKEGGSVNVEALKNIDLKLEDGDRVGLAGHNGAGKTSLLKVLSQIYEPSQGTVTVSGQTSCLFDIMMGMDQELTGYENIVLRGLILGLSKKETEQLVPDIEEFAGLGAFMNMPIKTYSSGMMVRLAFGIVTSISSEILLIDEVVNVGDASFVEKAKNRMKRLIHKSAIMVLSTHDHQVLREFCNKVVCLEKGQITFFGDIDEALPKKKAALPEDIQEGVLI